MPSVSLAAEFVARMQTAARAVEAWTAQPMVTEVRREDTLSAQLVCVRARVCVCACVI